MSNKIKFELKGIEEVKRLLKDLPNQVRESVQLDLNRKAGQIVKKEIESITPDGDNDKASKNKAANNVAVAKERGSKTNVNIGFKKRAWYILLQERGTKVRTTKGKGRYRKKAARGRIGARPFILRAHQNAFPKAVEFLEKNYLRIINNSIKKQLRSLNKLNSK